MVLSECQMTFVGQIEFSMLFRLCLIDCIIIWAKVESNEIGHAAK